MDLLTVQEAARALRLSPITIRRYIKSGRLRCVRLGRSIRLRREDVEGLGSDDEVARFWRTVKPISEEGFAAIIGIMPPEGPTDVALNKHEYLLRDYEAKLVRDREETEPYSAGQEEKG